MIPQVNIRRRLVPRWRSLHLTMNSRELDAPVMKAKNFDGKVPPDLISKLARWRREQTIITAGELVESTLVEAREYESVAAARFLISENSTATLSLQRLAKLALGRAGVEGQAIAYDQPDMRQLKRIWRERTRQYPQNALAWVELSLLDTNEGRRDPALRSMQIALQLAPHNRHVIRSAARLFLHAHDPERAYLLLARNERTKHDPWLISAELALADLAGKKPKYFVQGRQIVESSGLFPRQFTELAGALATLELDAGKRKRARDYFQTSLIDPNGNALAQAEWAAPNFGMELVNSGVVERTSDADEAQASHATREGDMQLVIDACCRWSLIEPYSLRPWEMGAITASIAGDFETAIRFASGGLHVRPAAQGLINTKAFSLASSGRLLEASQALTSISEKSGYNWLVSEANRGLIDMRLGNIEAGVKHYKVAIDGFQAEKNAEALTVAQLYFFREAARAGIDDVGPKLKQMRDLLKRYSLSKYERIILEAEAYLESPLLPNSQQVGPLIKATLESPNWLPIGPIA